MVVVSERSKADTPPKSKVCILKTLSWFSPCLSVKLFNNFESFCDKQLHMLLCLMTTSVDLSSLLVLDRLPCTASLDNLCCLRVLQLNASLCLMLHADMLICSIITQCTHTEFCQWICHVVDL